MAASWTVLDPGTISVTSVQAPTEAAPTLASDGMSKEAVIAVTIILDAGAGQTILSDYGEILIYEYDNGQWADAPTMTVQIPPGSAGNQRVSIGTFPVENRRGRMAPICFGVEVSGASVSLDVLATIDRRGVAKAV